MVSPQKPLCVLSLDGGGVRGLSELIILEKLMVKLQEQQKAADLPKPCDVFDMICGTSTGGIIALMLGRLQMSVTEVKEHYCIISEEVFGHPKHTGDLRPGRDRFSAKKLETVMKKTIAGYKRVANEEGDPELKLLEGSQADVGCKVFVCTRNARAMNTARLFRSYKVYDVGTYEEEMKVWQAGRATSAAPTFFKRLEIGPKNAKEEFVDGGLGSNNPTKKLLEEIVRIYEDRDVSCIVSIGAGRANIMEYRTPGFWGKAVPMNLVDNLKKMATDCEQTDEDLSKRFLKRPGVYFRFNVEHGLENIGLEEWKELGNITAKTNEYLLGHKIDLVVKEAVSQLHAPTAKLKASDLSPSMPSHLTSLPTLSAISPVVDNHAKGNFQEIEECYESLKFAQIETRREDVNPAFEITFQWLLGLDKTHSENDASPFLKWLSNHSDDSNVFWLSGKAGSGKSTLMKLLHDYTAFKELLADWRTSKKLSQLVVAGFYFYERGNSDLQKSREGFLRALLYSLLSQAPAFKPKVLGPKITPGHAPQTPGPMLSPVYVWSRDDLEKALLNFMTQKPDDMGVYLFADGLDECLSSETLQRGLTHSDEDDDDEGQFTSAKFKGHKEIADFHLKLARYSNTKICISSRPLEIFYNRFSGFPGLKLEDLTRNDIKVYVSETLQQASTSNGITAEELDYIVNRTVDVASGVFLWVVLVVDQLEARMIKGDGVKELNKRLHDTPKELVGVNGLFMRMLQDIDPHDREQGQHFFETVRCTDWSISALLLSFSEDTREEVLRTPIKVLSDQDVRNRVVQIQSRLKSRCAGLLELQHNSEWPEQNGSIRTLSDELRCGTRSSISQNVEVKYYHQTVKEFLQSQAVQRILTRSTSFDHTTLVGACIRSLKSMCYDPPKYFDIDHFYGTRNAALLYAQQAELATGKADTELLDHLDQVTKTIFCTIMKSMAGKVVIQKWWQDELKFNKNFGHSWVLEKHSWHENHRVLPEAVRANLCRYLKTKMSAAHYRRKPGRPLLSYAVTGWTRRVGFTRTYALSSISSLETVKILLDHGEVPNEIYHGWTNWEYMWNYFLGFAHKSIFQRTLALSMLSIIRLMVEAGADPNARIMYKDSWVEEQKSKPWRRNSCLFAILARFTGAQAERLELMKELARRDAQFYIGEKAKIEQDQDLEWAWPFVKDCQEREGPSDAQWKAWQVELEQSGLSEAPEVYYDGATGDTSDDSS